MNARTTFEPYRVILDYEALEDGFLDRIEDLNTTFDQIDAAAGFTRGNTQKLLSKSRERWARTLGLESMGKMLKGTGMALVLVVDDERFAEIKAELIARKRPKQAIARIVQPAWLFSKDKAREMGKKRWSGISDAKRKRLTKRAAKARWRKARKLGALLNETGVASSRNEAVAQTQNIFDEAKGKGPLSTFANADRRATPA